MRQMCVDAVNCDQEHIFSLYNQKMIYNRSATYSKKNSQSG